MPDTRLTWMNLKEHLRKFGWVYLVAVAVTLTAGRLLWIATTPRVPEDQRVLIYMADDWSSPEPLKDVAADALTRAQAEDDSLREVVFESLLFSDPDVDYTGLMVLMTRLAVGEGDVFLACGDAMDALVNAGACLPLDDYRAAGWLSDSGLEPYYAEVTDEETGETATRLVGLRLDGLDALRARGAFNNEGAFLAVAANGTNVETSVRVAAYIVEDLQKGGSRDA